MERTAEAISRSLNRTRAVTHVGYGKAKVDQVASNRRVLGPDGKVKSVRYSSTKDETIRAEPEGIIDPYVHLLSFWSAGKPLASLTYYATHPQSYYGQGGVSCDSPGLARGMGGAVGGRGNDRHHAAGAGADCRLAHAGRGFRRVPAGGTENASGKTGADGRLRRLRTGIHWTYGFVFPGGLRNRPGVARRTRGRGHFDGGNAGAVEVAFAAVLLNRTLLARALLDAIGVFRLVKREEAVIDF